MSVLDKKSSGKQCLLAMQLMKKWYEMQLLNLAERSTRKMFGNVHPQIAVVQGINEQDEINRLEFGYLIRNNYEGVYNNIFMSNEAHFYLKGDLKENKHPGLYWVKVNPCEIHQRPLHCPKVQFPRLD